MRGGDQPRSQGTSASPTSDGIHSGPVSGVVDVNERANLAGMVLTWLTSDGLRTPGIFLQTRR